jgi:GNAT superfamily N-acetyltransferase
VNRADALMPKPAIQIRDAAATDEAAWRLLWSDYNQFYEATIPEIITAQTWQRILDPACPVSCRLAVIGDDVAGFAISVLHESTWTATPVCYLEDLFVAPTFRGHGCGRLLIADLVKQARAKGWSRLYWHTRAGNPARRLYDEFADADDFVRYRMSFD